MQTRVDQIADRIYRLSTWFPEIGPAVPLAYRRLADLAPARLAIMHGSSYEGDCARLLRDMAGVYERRYGCLAAG